MKDNLISVILTVYNREKCLSRCIDSVLSQKDVNLELIIIDDGSSDSSPQICDRYAATNENVRVIHKKNEGISIARNMGLDNAKGDYIFFIDDDDFLPEDALYTLLSLAQKHDTDLVIGNYAEYNDDISLKRNIEIPEKYSNKMISNREACEFLQLIYETYIIIVNWAKLYKKNVWDGIRFPDEVIKSEDQFVFPKIMDRCEKIYVTDKVVYNQVMSEHSITRSSYDRRFLYHPEGNAEILKYLLQKKYYDLALFNFRDGANKLMRCNDVLADEECVNEIQRLYMIYHDFAVYLLPYAKYQDKFRLQLFIMSFDFYASARNIKKKLKFKKNRESN